jgi:hypothetical protein
LGDLTPARYFSEWIKNNRKNSNQQNKSSPPACRSGNAGGELNKARKAISPKPIDELWA